MNSTRLRRTAALAMSAALLLSSVPAFAIDDGVTPTFDEAYYATTDYYGNLTEASVVKSYATNGAATLTDYGDYDEIVNLTDGTAPATTGSKHVFTFDGDDVPAHFYFEGKTTKPFDQLPWTLSVHYSLNGVAMKAEELAGKTGVVEITLDAVPNENASEYARNNYTLEAMAIFNQDDILSLEAPGAQVQLIGNLRAVLFIGLPGEECHYTIRVGSDDFAFGGMTFLMVPATLSQLEEIAKLSARKDDLEENYEALSGSMDSLLDAMAAMTGSLNASASGLDRLEQARDIFSSGKGALYTGTDALRSDLSNLATVLEPVESQIAALSQTITDSKATLNSMTDTLGDLKDDLRDAERALSALESGTGDVKKVLSSLGDLRQSLKTLQKALGGQVTESAGKLDDAIDKNQNVGSTTVSQVKEAHSAYAAGREEYYVIALKQQGYSSAKAAATASAAVEALSTYGGGSLAGLETALSGYQAQLTAAKAQLTETRATLQALLDAGASEDDPQVSALQSGIQQLEAGITELETGIASLEGAIALETAYQAKEGMTFQTFCQKVLGQSAATAKQMNDLWLVYASGKVEYEDEEKGNTPEDGGTLSGELLHNDPAPDDSGSGSNDSGTGSSDNGSGSTDNGSGSTDSGTGSTDSSTGSTDSSTGSTDSSSGSTDSGTGSTDSGSSATDNDSGSTDNGIGSTDTDTGDNAGTGDNTPGTGDGTGTDGNTGTGEIPTTPENPETPLEPSESVGGAVVDLIAGGLDSAMAEIDSLRKELISAMNKLKNPTTQVVSDLAALCGRIEDLTDLLDDAEDLSAAVRHSSADLRSILGDVEDLQDTLNDYEPVLQETLQTVSTLSTSAIQTIRDTESLVADTESLMKSTGTVLDDGTRQTLQGLAEVLRQTAKTMSTAGEIKTAKNSICGIIEDTWSEYTGDVNNLLLMDATAGAVSLTDTRNGTPQSVQVLIRTQEIQRDDGEKEELTGKTVEKTTFWQRLARMFRDFWSAITGIFKGKD